MCESKSVCELELTAMVSDGGGVVAQRVLCHSQ